MCNQLKDNIGAVIVAMFLTFITTQSCCYLDKFSHLMQILVNSEIAILLVKTVFAILDAY